MKFMDIALSVPEILEWIFFFILKDSFSLVI